MLRAVPSTRMEMGFPITSTSVRIRPQASRSIPGAAQLTPTATASRTPLDKCPNTPAGVKVDAKGCPVDSDGDGVPDYLDKCPGTPRGVPVGDDGCPVKGIEVAGDEWFVRGRVLFDLNRATIKPEAGEVLLRVANFLKKNQQYVGGDSGQYRQHRAQGVEYGTFAETGGSGEGVSGHQRRCRRQVDHQGLRSERAHRTEQHSRRPGQEPAGGFQTDHPLSDRPIPSTTRPSRRVVFLRYSLSSVIGVFQITPANLLRGMLRRPFLWRCSWPGPLMVRKGRHRFSTPLHSASPGANRRHRTPRSMTSAFRSAIP